MNIVLSEVIVKEEEKDILESQNFENTLYFLILV